MTTPNQDELEEEADKLLCRTKLSQPELADVIFFAKAYAQHKVEEERKRVENILHDYYVYMNDSGSYDEDPEYNQLIEIIKARLLDPKITL